MKNPSQIDVKLPLAVIRDQQISEGAMLLYGILCGLSSDKDCFASNEYIAQLLHMNPRSVQRRLRELKAHGYIAVSLDNSGEDKPRRIKPIGIRSAYGAKAAEKRAAAQGQDASLTQQRGKDTPCRSKWDGVEYKL